MTLVGIEGGGSKTRALIEQGGAGPKLCEWDASIKVKNGDFEASATKLAELLEPIAAIDGLAIGLSGMSRSEDQDTLKSALKKQRIFGATHAAEPDGETVNC